MLDIYLQYKLVSEIVAAIIAVILIIVFYIKNIRV